MASHGTVKGSEKCRQRGPKTGITRVRTGCLTCRRRRKKCDERHPKCLNCEKTNVYCEGFPQAAYWQARNGLRNSSTPTPLTEFKEVVQHSPMDVNIASARGSQLRDGAPSYRPGDHTPSLHHLEIGSNLEEVGQELIRHFEYQGLPPNFETINYQDYSPIDLTRQYGGCNNTYREVFLDRGQRDLYQDQEFPFNLESKIALSPELPFPVSGIDTIIHRRLFCHFTTVMTSILTTFAVDCNPFKTIIIPLALGDTLVMDTLLCLAAVHLVKIDPDRELMKEKERIHESAVQAQASRISMLMENNTKDSHQHESILATSLLLCLYEICLGSGDSNWRVHLDIARNVINLASTATPTGAIVKTELNPFLLEFFVYHDSIAMVTVPQASSTKPHFDSLKNLPVKSSSLVGVRDGLTEFIERISALRNQAEASSTHPNGDVVCKATQIWSDLNSWKPNIEWSQPRKLITTFYQRALVIWLFAILNPDNKVDARIQDEVHHICRGMAEIKPDDGVMACLLFPLFIVATAAVTGEDRARICGHFERLRAWSSLGNVDLTFKIVRKMWVDHDDNVPGSWDWVKQLHDHNLSFMVT